MDADAMSALAEELHAWHEFYLLLGTSAAALTGLMFVVVSISPETIATRPFAGIRAFVSPTVVYFTTVLVVSGAMMAPHLGLRPLALLLGLGGIAGLAYMLWIDAHRQWREAKLEGDDWFWYIGMPALSYLLLLIVGIALWFDKAFGAWMLAFAMVLLLVTGIRNGWDLAIWMAQRRRS